MRCRGAAGSVTGMLVVMMFVVLAFAGLAVLGNVKAIFFLAPLALLAWRLGVRVRGIDRTQRLNSEEDENEEKTHGEWPSNTRQQSSQCCAP